MSKLTKCERESIVRWSDGEPDVTVWTSSPSELRHLRADDRFQEVSTERYGEDETAEFRIPRDRFVLTKAAKRVMSAAERRNRAGTLFGSQAASAA